MSTNVIDRIRPTIEGALQKRFLGDTDVLWDAGHVLVPTPQGASIQGLISLMCQSVVLGHPPFVVSVTIPSLMLLTDQSVADSLILQLVEALAERRSAALEMPVLDIQEIKGC